MPAVFMWEIQTKLKTGTQWEPVSVERESLNGTFREHRFYYETLQEAMEALHKFFELENTLPGLLVNMMRNKHKMRQCYDFRFAAVTHTAPLNEFKQFTEESKKVAIRAKDEDDYED